MSADPTITLSWGFDLADVVGVTPRTLRLTGRLGTRGATLFREQFAAAGASGRSYDYRGGGAALRRVTAAARGAGGEALFVALRTVDERYDAGEY